jgi:hypothetical protein
MMHGGVPHDGNGKREGKLNLRMAEKAFDHLTDLLADELGQFLPLARHQGKLKTTHHIAAMHRLGVQGGLDGKDLTRRKINQLGGEGGGSEVHSDSMPVSGLELKVFVVG